MILTTTMTRTNLREVLQIRAQAAKCCAAYEGCAPLPLSLYASTYIVCVLTFREELCLELRHTYNNPSRFVPEVTAQHHGP